VSDVADGPTGTAGRGGRPRRPGVSDTVLAATVDQVAEQGYARANLDGIARRAGVAKTTVYRRWSSKGVLAVDALVGLLGEPPDVVRAGPEGLRDALRWLADRIGQPQVYGLLVGVVTEAGRDLEVRSRLRAGFRDPFVARLVQEWALPVDRVDLAFDLVVGALLHRLAMTGSLTPSDSEAVTAVAVGLLFPR